MYRGRVKSGAMRKPVLQLALLRRHNLWYLISVLVIALDQMSKYWAVKVLQEEGRSRELMAYFDLTLLLSLIHI